MSHPTESRRASPARVCRRAPIALLAALVLLVFSACGGDTAPGERPFAFVTNGKYAFWEPARAGVIQAGIDLGVPVVYRAPENDLSDQKQVLEDLLNRDVSGIAVSVLDPDNQNPLLDRIAARVPVVTHDSDAPRSKRRCFIGVDNYAAGRMVGDLVRSSLPDGGKLALFIGNLSQDNARLRRQGLLDVVLGRAEPTPLERSDPTGAPLSGGGFTVVGTYTDDGDRTKAKANTEDALNRHPDLAGVVGFFQYNPPACLNALRSLGRLGTVQVFGFDEHEDTLDGIERGDVAGTVVQNPFEYGYQSIKMLVGIAAGSADAVPAGGVFAIPARTITKANLAGFRAELDRQMAVLEAR